MTNPFNSPFESPHYKPSAEYKSPWQINTPQSRESQSPDNERVDHSPSRRRRIGRRLLALIASGSVLLTGVGFSAAHILRGDEAAATKHTDTPGKVADITDIDSRPSEQLLAKFEADLSGSTCDTPETAERAAHIYHDAFEAIDFQNATNAELIRAAETLSVDMNEIRSRLEFAPLPDSYDSLKNDIESDNPSLPVESYLSALNDMLTPLGREATYSWTPPELGDHASPLPPANLLRPLSQEELDNNSIVRRAIFGSINAYALQPVSILSSAEPYKIYFGEILDTDIEPAAVGYALSGHSYHIGIDVTGFRNIHADTSVAVHEWAHLYQNSVCSAELDLAWRRQNPEGFIYNEATSQALDESPSNEEGITTLHNIRIYDPSVLPNDPVVVATRSYGTKTQSESFATLVGENLFYPHDSEQLFIKPEWSESIYAQLAIHIARQEAINPEVARLYTLILQAASLEQTATKRQEAIADELIDLETAFYRSEEYRADDTTPLPAELQAVTQANEEAKSIVAMLHNIQIGPLAD